MNAYDNWLASPYTDGDRGDDAIENKRSELDAMPWKDLLPLLCEHVDMDMVAEAVMEHFGDQLAEAIIQADIEDSLLAQADARGACYD